MRKKISFFILMLFILSFPARRISAQNYDVDTHFRPKINGFSFANYGMYGCSDTHCIKRFPVENLTVNEMVRLFGLGICRNAQPTPTTCRLMKVAESWMKTVNQTMKNGHCEGMAVLSSLMYAGILSPQAFGADSIHQLQLENNLPLQHEIAFWFATQWYMDDYIIQRDPASLLKILIRAYKNNPKLLIPIGLMKRDFTGGHTVTAYGIEDQGKGIYWIMIYDNNYPNVERHITVDLKNNSWNYVTSSVPGVVESLYDGQGLENPFQLVPVNSRLGQFECDFCPLPRDAKENMPSMNKISVNSNINLYIENQDRRKIGFDWKTQQYLNEIDSVDLRRTMGKTSVKLPTDQTYYLWFNSPESRDWASFDVSVTAPGSILYLNHILESYEYPNLIFKTVSAPEKYNHPFETFEVLAYPDKLPSIDFILSREEGECEFDLALQMDGDATIATKMNVLVYHNYELGEIGIELYPATDHDADIFKNVSFSLSGTMKRFEDEGDDTIHLMQDTALPLKIGGVVYFDYTSWLRGEGLYINGDLDGDQLLEYSERFQKE